MIVHRFLNFLRTATVQERVSGASALVRAYLVSDLTADDRAAAEAAMTVLQEDRSPAVRAALAEAVADSPAIPRHIVLGLADDQPEISSIVLRRSPLLLDGELVEVVARGGERTQRAVAERRPLSIAVAAAVAEVAEAPACAVMLDNSAAHVAVFSIARLVERHGRDPSVRERLLARPDLPARLRQRLATDLGDMLSAFVADRAWLSAARAAEIAREAVDKVTLQIVDTTDVAATADLVEHLSATGQLNAVLILRGLCAGNLLFLEEALVHLTGVSRQRVASLVHSFGAPAFQALYRKARLPNEAYPAFQVALDVVLATEMPDAAAGRARYARQVLERILTKYRAGTADDSDALLLLLRKFAADAAREEARLFADAAIEQAPRLLPAPQAA
jgi:uncharacterized protein (DUF2336 family)